VLPHYKVFDYSQVKNSLSRVVSLWTIVLHAQLGACSEFRTSFKNHSGNLEACLLTKSTGYHRGRQSYWFPLVLAWLTTRGNLHNNMLLVILSILRFLWQSSVAIRFVKCATIPIINFLSWALPLPAECLLISHFPIGRWSGRWRHIFLFFFSCWACQIV